MNSTAFRRNRAVTVENQVEVGVEVDASCTNLYLEAADQVENQVAVQAGCLTATWSHVALALVVGILRVRTPCPKAFEDFLHLLHQGFWKASFAVVEYQELLEQLHGFPTPRHFLYAGSV
jgi:hypothetical protein